MPDTLAPFERLALNTNHVRQSPGSRQGPRNASLQGTGVGASSSPPSAEVAAAEQRERETEEPVVVPDVREVEGTATKHEDEEEEMREVREDSMAQPQP